jgi:hypothetical protein
MSDTYDYTAGTLAVAPGVPGDNVFIIKSPLITIPSTAVTNDVFEVLPIKAGWKVLSTAVKIVTAGVGGTITADIGYGSATDYFDAEINLEGSAGTVYHTTPSDTDGALGGHYFSAADTIDILMHDVTSAITTEPVVYVYAVIEVLR